MHAILIAGIAMVGLPVLLHLIMKQQPKKPKQWALNARFCSTFPLPFIVL